MKKLIAKILVAFVLVIPNVNANNIPSITVASTTSTENSGLFDYLLPEFSLFSGIKVNILPQGTGQAIQTAQNGDADVLLVHHTPSEELFVQNGFAEKRYDLMYNDFIIIGPKSDPAKITDNKNIDAKLAFRKIAATRSKFISRGDESGTQKKELSIWREAGVLSRNPSWYIESGSSMGATINMAIAQNAYTLTDRATWLSFKNKQNFKIILQGDKKLFNQYGIMVVSNKIHKHIKKKYADIFVNWLLSPRGQSAINNFKINGQQLFFANFQK